MLFPILPTLAAARPLVPEALVGVEPWARVLGIASRLPDAAVMHYLECRLAPGVARVDYQITSKLSAGSGPIIAGRRPSSDFPPAWLASPAWERIQAFFRTWDDEASTLRRFAPIAGLEFDLEGPEPDPPVPQVLFCIDPRMDHAFHASLEPPPSDAAVRDAIVNAFSVLRGRSLARASEHALARCFDVLPTGGRIIHLAALIARPGDVIRCVALLPTETVLDYLGRIGWRGPWEAVCEATRRLGRPGASHVKIDVDIDDGVLPKFALAAEFTQDGASGYLHALPFLDELVRMGLCCGYKRDALAGWPGRGPVEMAGYGWPITLERHMDFKLVVWPDERLEAKAYLGLHPCFSLL